MQVVGRKASTIIVQVLDGRLEGHVHRPHVQLFAGLVGLAQIAGRAGSDHVVPGGQTSLGPWNEMIEGQFFFRAAILTLKFVAEKNVEAGEGGITAWFNKGLKRDNTR